METLDEFMEAQRALRLLKTQSVYTKGTRRDITTDVYRNVIVEVKTFRCTSCGQYKAPTKNTRCDKCIEQLEFL